MLNMDVEAIFESQKAMLLSACPAGILCIRAEQSNSFGAQLCLVKLNAQVFAWVLNTQARSSAWLNQTQLFLGVGDWVCIGSWGFWFNVRCVWSVLLITALSCGDTRGITTGPQPFMLLLSSCTRCTLCFMLDTFIQCFDKQCYSRAARELQWLQVMPFHWVVIYACHV
jgi:hypothetical protein